MPYPYAAIVWDYVLPLQTLDEQAIFDFYAAYGEQNNPERQCARPTASPPPAPTQPPASPSPASSAPASSESAAPAAS